MLLHILIDGGRIHNFLDPEVAKKLGCELERISLLSVVVASGTKLQAQFICRKFSFDEFADLFQKPTQLPSTWSGFDHRIPLKEGATVVNQIPYRYSTIHKPFTDQLVEKMFAQSFIRHSTVDP